MAGNDQMIEHGEVDSFTGEREATGDQSIGRGRGRIAAGVVMRDDYPRAAVHRCIGNNGAQRQAGPAIVTVMPREVDAPRLVVDMRNPHMFLGAIGLGEAFGEEAPRGFEAVQ